MGKQTASQDGWHWQRKQGARTLLGVFSLLTLPSCLEFPHPDATYPFPPSPAAGVQAPDEEAFWERPGATGATPRAQPKKTYQEVLIERIKQVGGSAAVEPGHAGGPLVGIDLHHTHVSDADLEAFQGLNGVRTLNLYRTNITDVGLSYVGSMTGLQTLYLSDTQITDAGLQHLRKLKDLHELGLNRTRVTDEGMAHLRGLTELTSLSLDGTAVTDTGLAQLRGLRKLKTLFLNKTGITPAGIREIKDTLPNVEIIR
jgi:hypothetical protein